MRFPSRRRITLAFLVLVTAALLPGRVAIWIDARGRPTLSNRPPPAAADAIQLSPEDLRLHWEGSVVGEPLVGDRDSSDPDDRFSRELLGARADIARGEMRSGLRRLRRLHRAQPYRPEPAWLLAQVERRRGRLEPARDALEIALGTASPMPFAWREAADTLLGEIDAELAHAEQAYVAGAEIQVQEAGHFRVSYDHQFAGRRFGDEALGVLERVRIHLEGSIGRTVERTLDVRLYTKAQYLESYEHRFGFATVGFYDGAIHVVAGRHPERNLYALLVHEYAHAIFEEALGSHQPFFLNEGIADREEERARGRDRLSRGEWRQLLDALRGDTWIRLHSIVRGFGGLEGKRALLAYLESRAVVQLIERERPGAIAAWLDRCARGEPWEDALERETGWKVYELETALIDEVRSRFPADPLAEISPLVPNSRSPRDSASGTLGDDRRASSRSGARAPV